MKLYPTYCFRFFSNLRLDSAKRRFYSEGTFLCKSGINHILYRKFSQKLISEFPPSSRFLLWKSFCGRAYPEVANMSELSAENLCREQAVKARLEKLGIEYEEFRHRKVMTMQALQDTNLLENSSYLLKNLFLKDKNQRYFFVSLLAGSEISLKELSEHLNAPKLRFADKDLLTELLNVEPGSATPLAIFEDKKHEITLVLDEGIMKCPKVGVHPAHNHATFFLQPDCLLTYIADTEHSPVWISSSAETAKAANTKENLSAVKTSKTASNAGASSAEANLLGLTQDKEEAFADWYTQVITKGELIEYYDISGCYIVRPWAFSIWEFVRDFFDKEIRKLEVENASFPLFITKGKLETEKDHIEGFRAEVAWVTKYGDSDLAEPIAIRPTSETIMYPAYAKWIRSHRDLPLKINQWNTVVRWEFKQPTPFLRTREFLWQEGHTAHATEKEAYGFVLTILELYRRWYEEYLAVPVIKGFKSENEKFAGAKMTTTIEAFISGNGRGIQAATSHLLGTGFAKIFGIEFEDEVGQKQLCQQTSWGCTTRSLGIMVMTHGDQKGLVIPPKVCAVQVIIIPILYKDVNSDLLLEKSKEIKELLLQEGIRVKLDERSNYTPGWKFNHWELKGVPLRLELGPKDLQSCTFQLVRRDNFAREVVTQDNLVSHVSKVLTDIQSSLLSKAKTLFDDSIVRVYKFDEVIPALQQKKLILAPWCEEPETEEEIKKEVQRLSEATQEHLEPKKRVQLSMKSLCIPFDQPEMLAGTKCFWTGKDASRWCLWGRSY